ncbi:MAG: hypothetical protein ACRDOH_27675 [Streptosporangiaceae bacterium]
MAAGCGKGCEQAVAVLAFGVRKLPGADSTVTFGGSQLLHGLQPGLVLPSQGLPLPGRVITGLPDLITGIGFGLAGAGQLSIGSLNQRRRLRAGLVAFCPRRLSDPARQLSPGPPGPGGHTAAGQADAAAATPRRTPGRPPRTACPGTPNTAGENSATPSHPQQGKSADARHQAVIRH